MEQAVLRNLAIICICLCTLGYVSINYKILPEKIGITEATPINKPKTIKPEIKKEVVEASGWTNNSNSIVKSQLEPSKLIKIEDALKTLDKNNKSKNGLLNINKEIYNIKNMEYIEFYPKNVKLNKNNNIENYSFTLNLNKDNHINKTKFNKEKAEHSLIKISFEHEKIINNNKESFGLYNKKDSLESVKMGVTFYQTNVKFKKILNFPSQIVIIGDNLDQNYKCKKIEDTFLNLGANYIIQYNCPLLPNIYDYKGTFKILLLD